MHACIIQSITRQISRTEALQKNIGLLQQLQQQITSAVLFKIQGNASLIAVQHQMPIAHALSFFRPKATRRIALQILNLDNIRAVITQQHTAILSRQPLGKINNLNTF